MIDLHCHLLPNIDDGSRSAQRSVEVLERMAADGVVAVVLTPHVKASDIESDAEHCLEVRERAYRELTAHSVQRSAVTEGRGMPRPYLYAGFEIMLNQPLPTLAIGDRRFALAGSRYYLVEFPLTVVGEFATGVLRQISQTGVVPLVAHPERYDACTPATVEAWRDAGARMQVDATALTRPTTRGHRARQLVAGGLADVVAADNHGDRRTMVTAVRFLRDHSTEAGGATEAAVARLTAENPRAVIDDSQTVDVPPVKIREGLLSRLRRVIG